MASSKFQDTGDPAQRQIYCNSTTSGYIPYSPLKSAAHSQVSKKEYRHKFAGSLYMHQERTTIYDKVFSLTDHPNAAFEPQVHKTTLPMPNALKWSGEIFRRVFTAITSMDIPFSVALVRKIAILIRPWRLVKTPLSNFHCQPQRLNLNTTTAITLVHEIDDHTVLSTVQAAENLLRLSAALESSLAQSLYKEAPTPRPPNEQFDCSVSFSSFAIPHDRSHYEDASSCDSKIGPGYWSGDEIICVYYDSCSPPNYDDIDRMDSTSSYNGPAKNSTLFELPGLVAPTNVPGAILSRSKDLNFVEDSDNMSVTTEERPAIPFPSLEARLLGRHSAIEVGEEIVQLKDTAQQPSTDVIRQICFTCDPSTSPLGTIEEYQAERVSSVLRTTSLRHGPKFNADVLSTVITGGISEEIGPIALASTNWKVMGILPFLLLGSQGLLPLPQLDSHKPTRLSFGCEPNKARWIYHDSSSEIHGVTPTSFWFRVILSWERPSPMLDLYLMSYSQVIHFVGTPTDLQADCSSPDSHRITSAEIIVFPLIAYICCYSNVFFQTILLELPFRHSSLVAIDLTLYSRKLCKSVLLAVDQNHAIHSVLQEKESEPLKPTSWPCVTFDEIRHHSETPVSIIITPIQELPAITEDIGGPGELNSGTLGGNSYRNAVHSSGSCSYIRRIKHHEPKGSHPSRWCRLTLRRLGGPKHPKPSSCLVSRSSSRPFYSLPSHVLHNARAHGDSVNSGWVPDGMGYGLGSFDLTGFTDLPLDLGSINGEAFGSGHDPGLGLFEVAEAQNNPPQAFFDGIDIEYGPSTPNPQPQHPDGGDLPTQRAPNAPPPPVPLPSNLQPNVHGPAWNAGFVAGCKAMLQGPGGSHFQPHGDESDWNEGFVAGFTLASQTTGNRLPSKTQRRCDSPEILKRDATLISTTPVSPANNTPLTQPTAGSSNQAALLFSPSISPGLASQPMNRASSASPSLGTLQTAYNSETPDPIAPNNVTPKQKPAPQLEHTPGDSDSVRSSREKVKRHKCDKCAGTFARKYQLDDHKRKHNSQPTPHRCDVPECGKGFTNRANMRRHQKVHTGTTHDNNVTEA